MMVCEMGCLYSFKGSSVPPHLKTIGISLFDDQSGSGEPGLREKLTNKLIDKFRQDNSFQVGDKTHADALLEGVIVSVGNDPTVISQGSTVKKQRMSVAAKVIYQDMKLKKKVFEKQFSEWGDFNVSGGQTERDAAINTALDKLTDDIVNETVSGW
jgi:hypothetical protein